MAELHFCRLRKKDSNDEFLDPEADIKELMPKAFAVAEKHLRTYIKIEAQKDVDYLHSILKVLETRALEDYTPLARQAHEFDEAFNKLPRGARSMFMQNVGYYLVSCWLLHLRRDGQADKRSPRFTTETQALNIYRAMEPGPDMLPPDILVDAICVETNQMFHDIKDTASVTVGAAPGTSWDEAAAACDKYLDKNPDDVEKVVAASLAYPTYKGPYFEVTVNADSGKD